MNSDRPVEKLSQPTTRLPEASSASVRLLPIKPEAPVTNTDSIRPGYLPFSFGQMLRQVSSTARTAYNSGHRLEKNGHVGSDRAFLDVLQVHPHPIIKVGNGISSAYLPEAGDPRPHTEFAFVPQRISDQLMRTSWTRAHQTHVTPKHTPKLGEFIQAVFSQKTPERVDPRIILDLEHRPRHLIQVTQ